MGLRMRGEKDRSGEIPGDELAKIVEKATGSVGLEVYYSFLRKFILNSDCEANEALLPPPGLTKISFAHQNLPAISGGFEFYECQYPDRTLQVNFRIRDNEAIWFGVVGGTSRHQGDLWKLEVIYLKKDNRLQFHGSVNQYSSNGRTLTTQVWLKARFAGVDVDNKQNWQSVAIFGVREGDKLIHSIMVPISEIGYQIVSPDSLLPPCSASDGLTP